MNKPDQEQIDYWVEQSKYQIDRKHKLYEAGFQKEKNLPIQGMYTSLSLVHASLARAKFLNGDPIGEVRAEFARAARCMLKSFTMAYDPNDPDYLGDKWPPPNPQYTGKPGSVVEAKWEDPGYGEVSWADVCETWFIDGINYALMAADFALARELASWFQDSPDGYKMDIDVNRYAHALKHAVLAERDLALDFLLGQLRDYEARPPRTPGDRNYHTLITALHGIVTRDEKRFNEGLLMQIEFYAREGVGEYRNTDEEFICDNAVALANLGLHRGLAVTMEHGLLPKGLLTRRE